MQEAHLKTFSDRLSGFSLKALNPKPHGLRRFFCKKPPEIGDSPRDHGNVIPSQMLGIGNSVHRTKCGRQNGRTVQTSCEPSGSAGPSRRKSAPALQGVAAPPPSSDRRKGMSPLKALNPKPRWPEGRDLRSRARTRRREHLEPSRHRPGPPHDKQS